MDNISENSDGTPDSDHYAAVHDWDSGEHVVVSVAEALADHTGIPARELPPLYDSVDTDALDGIARTLDSDGADGRASVTFSVLESEYLVTVHADGGVEIDEQA